MLALQKKLSIPATISLVLKYIPEQQKHVDGLMQRKEEMVLKMSRVSSKPGDVTVITAHEDGTRVPDTGTSFPTVSARHVGDREVLIQICATTWGSSPVSKALEKLEEGFHLLNASSFTTVGTKVFHSLHLQVTLLEMYPSTNGSGGPNPDNVRSISGPTRLYLIGFAHLYDVS